MLNTFPNTPINTLSPYSFIGGSYQDIRFYLYTSACVAIDVTATSASGTWELFHYNQPGYIVLSKTSTNNSRYCLVQLFSEDTVDLSGKYMQQFKIVGDSGKEYVIGQGIITIIPAIGGS
jgi:hypothetical protein